MYSLNPHPHVEARQQRLQQDALRVRLARASRLAARRRAAAADPPPGPSLRRAVGQLLVEAGLRLLTAAPRSRVDRAARQAELVTSPAPATRGQARQ